MSSVAPSLVEAAARVAAEVGIRRGQSCIRADRLDSAICAAIEAVGDALRLEGAQAEHDRILALVEALPWEFCSQADYDKLLSALGGVHPEASDG